MDSIIDRATEHYEGLGTIRIEVKEWGNGKVPLVLYADQMNLDDKIRMAEITKQKSAADGIIWAIIKYLKTEDGKPAFTIEDRQKLKFKVDPNVLVEVFNKFAQSKTVLEMENF